MKLVHVGIISTSLVIIAGISLVAPAIIIPHMPATHQAILLFEITNSNNLPEWCIDLASKVQKENLKGVIFVPGEIAQEFPECVNLFKNFFDVGSSTLRYSSLESFLDYQKQLQTIQNGKELVDKAGNINSKIFKAPFGYTDSNIYSLLTRSGIVADFSYDKQYNYYQNGQFIRYEAQEITANSDIDNMDKAIPLLFNFDNSDSVDSIFEDIDLIKKNNVVFKSPSEIVGEELTTRLP
jgi:hypothetical protein